MYVSKLLPTASLSFGECKLNRCLCWEVSSNHQKQVFFSMMWKIFEYVDDWFVLVCKFYTVQIEVVLVHWNFEFSPALVLQLQYFWLYMVILNLLTFFYAHQVKLSNLVSLIYPGFLYPNSRLACCLNLAQYWIYASWNISCYSRSFLWFAFKLFNLNYNIVNVAL